MQGVPSYVHREVPHDGLQQYKVLSKLALVQPLVADSHKVVFNLKYCSASVSVMLEHIVQSLSVLSQSIAHLSGLLVSLGSEFVQMMPLFLI